jgi:hypothetical protein
MPPTTKFHDTIELLREHLNAGAKTFNLTEAEDGDIAKALKSILGKLPGKELSLIDAKAKEDSETKWIFSGKPVPGSPGWRLPGFKESEFVLPESAVQLTVEDAGQDDQGKDQEPKFKLGLSASFSIGGKTVPLSTTITNKDDQTFTLGKESKPTKLSLVALAKEMMWQGGADELANAGRLMKLDEIDLLEATLTASGKTGSMTKLSLKAQFVFGPVVLGLDIRAENDANGKFSRETMTFGATLGSSGKDFQLGEILSELAGVKVWPSALDPKLRSLSLIREYVPKGLNDHDTQRIVLQSPANSKKPEILVTFFFYNDGERYAIARLGWPSLAMPALPVVGDYLKVSFEPFFAILTSKTLTVPETVELTALDKFPELKTLGIPAEKAKEKTVPRGLHCTGVLNISDTIKVPFYRPVRASADEGVPFEIDKLPESRDAAATPIQRNLGPVRLETITLKYEQDQLGVAISGSIETKGFTLEVLGLGLSMPLKFPNATPVSLLIDGGLLSYRSSTLSISGGLVPVRSDKGIEWFGTGLLKVGDNFSLAAAFAYSDTAQKSLFLFAYVRRQLGGPTWCYITGLAAGFGYNRTFIAPPVAEVNSFPLIAMANELSRGEDDLPEKVNSAGLSKIVAGMATFLPASTTGDNFGVAGMTFTSFGYVNSTLLLSVMFGNRLEFTLLGSSLIQVPKGSGAGANAELQLVGAVRPDDGLIALDAVLSPKSYVLAKDCRLTGGFGLRVWFSGTHSGDFVVSLGGYHPGYIAPAHYPQVPRLGILWKYSNQLRISGFAYLAITPKNIQLGGGLDMVYESGPLRAWVHLQIHLLIGWSPFVYDAQLTVDFGISFRLDLLFCSTTITIEIGADLHIWGPPFAGHADIHLWFVSFGVDFGDRKTPQPVLQWPAFVSAFVTPSPTSALKAPRGGKPQPSTLPVEIIAVNGLTERKGATLVRAGQFQGRAIDWIADPQLFELQISIAIPAETSHFNVAKAFSGESEIYAGPVEGSPRIAPDLKVTFTHLDHDDVLQAAAEKPFTVKCTAGFGAVPSALWGKAVTSDQPPKPNEGKETVRAITHVSLTPEVVPPGESAEIDIDKLLFADTKPISLQWEPVPIPQRIFPWDTHNPSKTINSSATAAARNRTLADLARLGHIDADYAARIRLGRIADPKQPSFLIDPVACTLGTAKTADEGTAFA